ncbi:DUF2851 family protein [Sphingobacterium sp. SRCM116780]|uniref:DUF2851 family protein n=1 Tax=Sphingobacterium sp. SRCM116780 TaxID=2907623 RepID=UPI001F2C09CF|nr:DUF2851 family protein [Sphingobacterium sp. SRCM116780]UIR57014.1 DUF2851 family protein [Sphingobacterium sp. SRCM116780]
MAIPEDLLHFIWKLRLFQTDQLLTVEGKQITVLNVGEHNRNAGPDFLFSKIRIGEVEWVGSVEIHVKSSDWLLHQHQDNAHYHNVILHVVWEHNQDIFYTDGSCIPTLRLADYVPQRLLWRYQNLMKNATWIPCENQVQDLDSFKTESWLDRMTIERMEEKSKVILDLLDQSNGDWEKTFFIWLFRSFGFKVNAEAFQELGARLPLLLLKKYRKDTLKLEAIIFGQAGFLNRTFEDAYPLQLQKEYVYLQKIYLLEDISLPLKFLRMRPYNFPTIRLAQLTSLMQEGVHLEQILNLQHPRDFRLMLDQIQVAHYWHTHFNFEKQTSSPHTCQLSKRSQDGLIINVVVLFTFAYGLYFKQEARKEKAIKWLEDLPGEKNSITQKFENIGIRTVHAAHSQALLHIKSRYCDRKQCLSCGIGVELLKR